MKRTKKEIEAKRIEQEERRKKFERLELKLKQMAIRSETGVSAK